MAENYEGDNFDQTQQFTAPENEIKGPVEGQELSNYPPLSHEWCLYCDDGNFCGGKAQNYFEQMVKLGSFKTVENFWRFFNATEETLRRLAPEKFNMRMFKTGIKPMWEDPNNRKGGKWLISCNLRLDVIFTIWKEILVAAISGFPTDSDLCDLCGCVLVGRRDRMEVQLWTKKKPPPEKVESTCEFIRKLTREPEITNVQFISHQRAKKKAIKRLPPPSHVEEQKHLSSSSTTPRHNSMTTPNSIASSSASTPPTLLNNPPPKGNETVKQREGPLFSEDFHSNYESSSKTQKIGNRRNSLGNYTSNQTNIPTAEIKMNGIPKKQSTPKNHGVSPLRVSAKPFAPIMEPRVYIPSPEPISPKKEDVKQFPPLNDSSLSSSPRSNSLNLGPVSDQLVSNGSVWTGRKVENLLMKPSFVLSSSKSLSNSPQKTLNVKSSSPLIEHVDSRKENKSKHIIEKNVVLSKSENNGYKEPTPKDPQIASMVSVSTSTSPSKSFSPTFPLSSSTISTSLSTPPLEVKGSELGTENLDETSETTELEEDEDQGEVTPSEMEEELMVVSIPKKKKKSKRRKHKSTTTSDETKLDVTDTTVGVSSKPKKKKIIKKSTVRERKKIGHHKKREEILMERETTCQRLTITMKSHCIIL